MATLITAQYSLGGQAPHDGLSATGCGTPVESFLIGISQRHAKQ